MSASRKKVLIAEDNPALAVVIRFHLERAELEVISATNGREAKNYIDAAPEPFDLIITDHQMPELTGEELVRGLLDDKRHSQTPIILLTAKVLELDVTRLRDELGITKILAKPFGPSDLVRTAEECLRTRVPA